MRIPTKYVITFALTGLLVGCGRSPEPLANQSSPAPTPAATQSVATQLDAKEMIKSANTIFKPLPSHMGKEAASAEMVELGKMLYYDKRLSKDGTISCNSCHNLKSYGVDGEATSLGVGGQRGGRNAPTVYNAAMHIAQFWDGRSPDVEAQASGPMLNPVEMAMSREIVEKRLRAIDGYKERFAAAFPGEEASVSIDNAATAIAAFERGLVTPGAFDKFMNGDPTALNAEQLDGYKLFVDVGCASCHNGPAVGGRTYQKLGVKKPYHSEDLGRFEVTKKESDKMKFKVPSLRNIAQTGPYFHDGSVTTLSESISLMAEHQLGKDLSEDEVAKIEAFLQTLTGKIDENYISEPELPPGKIGFRDGRKATL